MHMGGAVRNATRNSSPTASRYSAAAIPQAAHSQFGVGSHGTGGLPPLYTSIPPMSQHAPILPGGGGFYHHGGRAGAAVGGGPHGQHHSHHIQGFEPQVGAPGNLLQHHELYERDNVGKEMLNLSQSQNSHTPTSFKMTSPFYEGKQTAKEAAYSRYDLKPEAEQQRAKGQH